MQLLLMHARTNDGSLPEIVSLPENKGEPFYAEEKIVCNHFRETISCNKRNLSLNPIKAFESKFEWNVDNAVTYEQVKQSKSFGKHVGRTTSSVVAKSFENQFKSEEPNRHRKKTSISQLPLATLTICCSEDEQGHNNKDQKTLNVTHYKLKVKTRAESCDSVFTQDTISQTKENCSEYCTAVRHINASSHKTTTDLKSVQNDRAHNLKSNLSATHKLSLSTQPLFINNANTKKNQGNAIISYSSRKRQFDSSADIPSTNSNQKRRKSTTMSVYDIRVQSAERSVGNGYITRGLHNDENSPVLGNHYYHNSSQPMIATLCNIGNTCYLNSVVYTLRFAPLFLHNLHHLIEDLSHFNQKIGKRVKSSSLGRNVGGLHTENVRSWSSKDLASLEISSNEIPKSNQQIATEKLHELYQNLHKNEFVESTEPFHADIFLRAIQDVSTIFEGNQQQDAHEFLMCVLDSIRETCQTLIKSLSECPELITNGLPEQIEITAPNKAREREKETSIIKTSFFSRRSKRKEDVKQPKGLRLNSPHKESGVMTNSHLDPMDSAINVKNIRSSISATDDDITSSDKERLREKIKQLGLDFFTEDFEGITVSTTKCLSCETVTEQKETMIDIAVPISGYESIDTSEKSQSFIQNSCITREYFRGENKYRCEQCIGYTEAIRSISYEVLPRLLVIQLSRFSGGMEKINSYLPTPFTLQCFCAKCCEQPENKKHHVYKLYSVITHVGATMSVGHYIAYTCSLDWANDYINCPKDRRRQVQLNSIGSVGSANGSSSNYNNSNARSSTTNALLDKNMGLMKKMRFGRSKASSNSDMSKQVKGVNGVPNKTLTNGVEKLNISATCPSLNCCGLRVKNQSSFYSMNYNNGSSNASAPGMNNGVSADSSDENSHSTSVFSATNSYVDTISYSADSKTKASANSQPTWYMCDDDKIKCMSQKEFEDLLSPNRKIMVTPYLLFYARRDLK